MSQLSRAVSFKDWDKLFVTLDEFKIKNRAFMNDLLFELGNTLLTFIARFAPFKTGFYVRSWTILNQSQTSITVGSLADPRLFVMLEFTGATAHTIRARQKIAMRFFDRAGVERFARIVFHKGFPAKPHVRPAMQQLRKRVTGIVYAVSARHFTLLKREGQRAATAHGYRRVGSMRGKTFGRSNVGRTSTDVTANIGRGTKGKIAAQMTSRRSFKKRIRVRGTRRVGTSEKKKAGFR